MKPIVKMENVNSHFALSTKTKNLLTLKNKKESDNMKMKRKFVAIPPNSKAFEFFRENGKSPAKLLEQLVSFYEENQELSKTQRAFKITEVANERIREIFPGVNLQELQGIMWIIFLRAAEGRYDVKQLITEIENLMQKMDGKEENNTTSPQISLVAGLRKGLSKEFLESVQPIINASLKNDWGVSE